MAMVDVGPAAQVSLLGLSVVGRLALPYIHQMKRVNSFSDFGTVTAP